MDRKLSRIVEVSSKKQAATSGSHHPKPRIHHDTQPPDLAVPWPNPSVTAPPFGLSLTYRRAGQDVIIEVCGELDFASAPQLGHGLTDVIDDQGCHSIIVDLQGLEFIDSTGLLVLVKATRQAQTRRASIILARPSAVTTRVLKLSGLLSVFDIRDGMPNGTA